MALKRSESNDSPVANRAENVFTELAKKRERGEINKTITVSFRLLESERERIEKILNQNGYTLASGAKKAFYDFVKKLERE